MPRPDELGSMPTGDFSRLEEYAERLEEAWKSQGDTTSGVDLSRFMPPAGDSLRLPVLYELIKTDLSIRMERGQLVGLEYYLEKFPEIGPSATLSPQLILEEYLIRRRHGIPAPLADYKRRYPEQYPRFEALIPKEHLSQPAPSGLGTPSGPQYAPPASASPPSAPPGYGQPGYGQPPSGAPPYPPQSGPPSGAPSGTPSAAPAFAAAPSGPADADQVPFFFGLGQGKTIGGHFVLIKRIGGGQFGEVWKALDTQGEIEKALKIILRPMDTEEAKAELQALEIIKRLNHPYLLRTESFWQAGDRLVIVMELADGSLRDVLKKCRKEGLQGIPVPDLLRYFHNAATALDYLHNKDIVHRDIKPDNILLVEDFAKVADLGLAKLMSHGRSMTASLAGTMAYMAPEVWRERISPRSDQYSLAVAYAELRQGKMPFHGRNLADFFHAHKDTSPDLDAIPKDEREVLRKALAKNPQERFLACLEFMRALDEAVSLAAPIERPAVRKAAASTMQVAALATVTTEGDSEARLKTLAPLRPGTGVPPEAPPEDEAPLTEKPHDTAPPKLKPPVEPVLEKVVKHTLADEAVTDKPVGWRTAAQGPAPITGTMPAAAPSAPARRRGWLAALVGLLFIGAAILGFAGYKHKGSLEEAIEQHVATGDFDKAFDATDGVLALPFRSGLRDGVRQEAIAFAKAALPDDPETAASTCQAAAAYFPNDADVRELWGTALEKVVLGKNGLLARADFEMAVKRIEQLPGESTVKTRLAGNVEAAWLQAVHTSLGEARWDAARKAAEAVVQSFPQSKGAQQVHKLAKAASEVPRLLAAGDHPGAVLAIPENLPEPALQKLRGQVKDSWATDARTRGMSERFSEVRAALAEWREFQKHFPGEPNELNLAQRQFCKLAIAEAERDAQGRRFEAGLKLLNEASGLAKAAEEQTAIQKQRVQIKGGHRDYLLIEARQQLDAKKPGDADVHLALLQSKERDPEYGLKDKALIDLQTLRARALAQTARDVDTVVKLLSDVNRSDNAGLEALCVELATACERDASYRKKAARPLLMAARMNLKDAALIARIIKLEPMVGLVESARFHVGTNPAKAAAELRDVELAALDLATKKSCLEVYEKLAGDYVDKGTFRIELADLLQMEKAAKESAKLAEIFPRAMARHIENTVTVLPKDSKEWKARLDACRKAEQNPLVKAHLSECLVALNIRTGFPALGETDTLTYEKYVRALRRSRDEKHSEAAQLIAALSPKEPWFIRERRETAAEVLRRAALQERPDGKLFGDSDKAANAYAWFNTALGLAGESTKEWPQRDRLDFALAAHFKAAPDARRVEALLKELGDGKVLDPADKDLVGMLKIKSYKDAVAYLTDAKKSMTTAQLLQDRLEPAIELGRIQVETALGSEMHALRLAAKGWLLYQDNSVTAARKAFDGAITLDGQKVDYWLERAECDVALRNWNTLDRDLGTAIALAPKDARPYSLRALVRLQQARQETRTARRADLLAKGLQDADQALAAKPDNSDLPTVLYRASMISLELGNYEYRLDADGVRKSQEWKQRLRDAARHAERIVAEFPKHNPDLIQVALGNACEDIAYFAKEDIDTRFAKAEEAFTSALALTKDDADRASRAVSRGRCRYRWTTRGMPPADTLKNALADVESALKSNPEPLVAAEAHYWKGMIVAADDPKTARAAFTAAIKLGEQAPEWAYNALTTLFDLDFSDGSALARTQPDVALQKTDEVKGYVERSQSLDALQKRRLLTSIALVRGEAFQSKKDNAKAIEAYRDGFPDDLDGLSPTPNDLRLNCKWVFARVFVGEKANLISDADRGVKWSNVMPTGDLTATQTANLKADAIWNAALARLTVNPNQYRNDAIEMVRECIKLGKEHPELWVYRHMLGAQLFELLKTEKDADLVERHREESLEQLGTALQLLEAVLRNADPAQAAGLRAARTQIEAKIAEVKKHKSR